MTKIKTELAEERRFDAANVEARAAGEGESKKMIVGGYACLFNSTYDMRWFEEEIASDAFAGVDLKNVVALFNHDKNIPLGRSGAGTLSLNVDKKGLRYDITLPDSPNGKNVYEAVLRGDISASSWAFLVDSDEWSLRNGKDHRKITKIRQVLDVSPVTFPANPDTTVAKRSKDASGDGDDEFLKQKNANKLKEIEVRTAMCAP